MNRIRVATIAAGVLVVGSFSATAATAGTVVNVPCTGQDALVSAIDAANSAGGGTLDLAHRCEYRLTTSPDGSENGLPAITAPITVNGSQATIDGTGSFRVFEVDAPGGSLSASDLTITGGSAGDFGGGIANFGGDVTLDHALVTGNSAGIAGGGIASATFDGSTVPTVTLRDTSVSGNQQTVAAEDGGGGGGGIINVDGTLALDHAQVNDNTAQGGVGGGIGSGDYFGLGGQTVLTVDHSQVDGNVAPNAGGGGIQNLLGSATLDHSEVNGNTALNGGGIASGNQGNPSATTELKLDHAQVDGNTATAGPGGEGPPFAAGGIANGSDAVIDHSQVDDNNSPNGIGAGIVNHGTMAIGYSEVSGNTAPAQGVLGSAGGILNSQGPPGTAAAVLTIDHSKVDDNSAPNGWGGGIANGVPLPGPISPPGGDLTLTNSEVTGNTAARGGGIFNTAGSVSISQSKVTGNHVDNCEPSIDGCTN